MNVTNIIVAICSLMFFMIGLDKFLSFLQPPCSLTDSIPTAVWTTLGVLQIAAGVLIWLPKYRKHVVGFFFVFMLAFSTVHLWVGTNDIGGAIFMAALLGLLMWNPSFIRPKK